MLDLYISEEEYMKWADQHKTEGIRPFSVVCKGIDSKSAGIKAYYLQTEHFYIQGMDLGSVPIYIVFDKRYKKILLGMDLLHLMNVNIDNDKDEMCMQLTQKYIEYRKKHLRTTIRSMFEMGVYSKKDNDIDGIALSDSASDGLV